MNVIPHEENTMIKRILLLAIVIGGGMTTCRPAKIYMKLEKIYGLKPINWMPNRLRCRNKAKHSKSYNRSLWTERK